MFLSDQHLPLPLTYLSHQAAASPGGGSRATCALSALIPFFSSLFPPLPALAHGFPWFSFPPFPAVFLGQLDPLRFLLVPRCRRRNVLVSALQAGRCARSALQAAQCARSALQAGRCARSALQAGRCARSALQAGRCARSALQAGRCARSVLQAGRCARSALQAGRCACSALQAGQCACSALQAGRYARSALQAARCARSALQAAQCARSALQAGRCARSALQAAQCARSALHVAQCARSALQARRVASFLIPALFCRFPALYEERMTVAPPPASQPITDGHVAGQVGNGAARREAREVAEHSSLLPCAHLCSPALTSAPLRSPLLPCAHLCSPALTSAPLHSPLLPALTSAPLHSPLLPCTHLYCSPTFHTTVSPSPTVHAIVSPSPTVHAIVSPSPNVHTTVSPSPVVHTTVFSPLFTHLLFPLFPLFTPLPSPLARHAPRTHRAMLLPSPHSLIARNIQPGVVTLLYCPRPRLVRPPYSPPLVLSSHLLSTPLLTLPVPPLISAPLRSPLLPCAHLCSPALTSAPLRSPLLPCAHLCSPALTSAPLRSPLLPCTHLCSPALTSAPLRSPLLPCAHLCSPALTSAPLRSPLLPCAHLCSPALTSAPLHSPLLPCTHLCSPALTFTVHPLFTPPFPRPPLFMPIVSPSPTVHAIVSPSRNVHTTVSPSPVVHTTVFSPLFTHLLFPLFPLFTPLPSPLARHAPRTHLLCSLPPLTHCPKQPARCGSVRWSTCPEESCSALPLEWWGGSWETDIYMRRAASGLPLEVVAGQLGDIYMFDEPSSYLDVRQRLKAAQVIRSLLRPDRYVIVVERDLSVLDYLSHFIYVIVVEHDLSVLDYLSDFICCLYGKPGAYGVVTLPFSVREGINIFLAGFVPTENLRFRDESLTFRGTKTLVDNPEEGGQDVQSVRYRYLGMIKKHGGFNLLLPLPHSILSPPFIPSQVAETPVAETPVDNPEEAKTYTRYKYPRMVKKQGGFKPLLPLPPLSIPSQVAETPVDNPEEAKTYTRYKYPRMVKKQGGFKLTVEPGDFTDSQIVVMLGENGTGKTTFIRMLVGKLSLMGAHAGRHILHVSLALSPPCPFHDPSSIPPLSLPRRLSQGRTQMRKPQGGPRSDEETGKEAEDLPEFNVSYKPQKISRKFPLSYPLVPLLSALLCPSQPLTG
ncbi:unnamed protein product, partial [Closterium sp. NIES-65]